MKSLYPPLEPYSTHFFQRSSHRIYVEQCGNPDGVPVLFLHGGPGSGCKPHHRRFFDPSRFRVVLADQRGSGRSTPHGEVRQNTTSDLILDLEYVRRQLGIGSWLLFGGSWGATLALLYAQRHVAKVAGLVLRGAFLARRRDLDWFIGEDGVRRIYPDGWAQFIDCLPIDERDDPMEALHKRLTGADELAQLRAARDWSRWTGQVTLGEDFVGEDADNRNSTSAVNRVRIEVHYAKNGYFITENEVLEQCGKLARLPAIIVHGRRDLVCPAESAYLLHRALPGSDLRVLPKAGHIADGEEMIDALVNAADEMAQRLAA